MDRRIVQHQDQRSVCDRALAKEGKHVVGLEMARTCSTPIEGRLGTGGDVERHRVVAPALGRLVRHAPAFPGACPGVRHGLAGAEAAFVEVAERDPAGGRLFLSEASTRLAWATCSASCLCRTVRWTRRQRAPIATRYLRVWRVLK